MIKGLIKYINVRGRGIYSIFTVQTDRDTDRYIHVTTDQLLVCFAQVRMRGNNYCNSIHWFDRQRIGAVERWYSTHPRRVNAPPTSKTPDSIENRMPILGSL